MDMEARHEVVMEGNMYLVKHSFHALSLGVSVPTTNQSYCVQYK